MQTQANRTAFDPLHMTQSSLAMMSPAYQEVTDANDKQVEENGKRAGDSHGVIQRQNPFTAKNGEDGDAGMNKVLKQKEQIKHFKKTGTKHKFGGQQLHPQRTR